VLEAVQQRLDANPNAMRRRRETVEHPFGTIKARMGATHFLMKTLPKVAAEMALHVLAYNLTRVMNIIGVKPLMAAIRGVRQSTGPNNASTPVNISASVFTQPRPEAETPSKSLHGARAKTRRHENWRIHGHEQAECSDPSQASDL
jgi:hypothetical protein